MNFEFRVLEWTEEARCAYYPNPDIWHYESSRYQDERELTTWNIAEAKRICSECPVKKECLAEGMRDENLITGNILDGSIWGGLMLGERLNLKHGRMTFTGKQERVVLQQALDKIAILDQ